MGYSFRVQGEKYSLIYLFENGSILEQGTHKELMELNGQYKKMFESQAIKYLGGDYNA